MNDSKYKVLVETLKSQILSGKYDAAKPFPSVRALIRRFGMSKTTVQRALDELFHDQGTTDQFALMRTYRELGLDVPVRGDHVPEMEGDRLITEDCIPGYFTMGRLFANGYLRALLQGTDNDR